MKRTINAKKNKEVKFDLITEKQTTSQMSLHERRIYEANKYFKIYGDKTGRYTRSKDGRHYGSGFHAQPILDYIKFLKIKSVIDVGTGNGEFPIWMEKNGCEKIYGVDIASMPSGGVNITWFSGVYAHKLPIQTGEVEYVTVFDVLEHLIEEDLDLALQEFKRVATQGVIGSVPENNSVTTIEGKWVNLHTIVKEKEWWLKKFEQIGYVDTIGDTNFFHIIF